jgi:hypothetical protein
MACEENEEELIRLAAGNAEPGGVLRAHLERCASCSEVWERERSLFSLTDDGLRGMANAEVPASLLPGLRGRLDQEAAPRTTLFPTWALATAVAFMVLAASWVWRTQWSGVPRLPDGNPQIAVTGHLDEESLAATVAADPAGGARARPQRTKQERKASDAVATGAMLEPEILVPPDEREALAKFLTGLPQRQEAAQVLIRPAEVSPDTPIEPLQIAGLNIEPLEGAEGRQEQDGESER